MKYIENKLGRQLLVILVVVFDIIIVTVAFFLPRMLRPIYETGIYNTLKSPIDLVDKSIPNNNISRDVAYLYVEDDKVYTSKNYDNIVNMSEYTVLRKINKEFGNFEYKGKKPISANDLLHDLVHTIQKPLRYNFLNYIVEDKYKDYIKIGPSDHNIEVPPEIFDFGNINVEFNENDSGSKEEVTFNNLEMTPCCIR